MDFHFRLPKPALFAVFISSICGIIWHGDLPAPRLPRAAEQKNSRTVLRNDELLGDERPDLFFPGIPSSPIGKARTSNRRFKGSSITSSWRYGIPRRSSR